MDSKISLDIQHILISELYKYEKKMHVRVSEILVHYIEHFILPSKRGKNTCSHGVYILIRAYIPVLKTY